MKNVWLHRYAVLWFFCTLFLVVAGGLVTSNDAGLSVPDWPLSYGRLMPPMEGNIFYEHGHRMVATTVGLLTIGMADRKSTRLNSSHVEISYAVFCLKKKNKPDTP